MLEIKCFDASCHRGSKMRFAASAFELALGLLVAAPASAEGWTADLTISTAFTEDSDLLVVSTTDGIQSTPGCTINQWIINSASEERRARAWATVLTAIGTGKKIRFWTRNTCATWSYHDVMIVP